MPIATACSRQSLRLLSLLTLCWEGLLSGTLFQSLLSGQADPCRLLGHLILVQCSHQVHPLNRPIHRVATEVLPPNQPMKSCNLGKPFVHFIFPDTCITLLPISFKSSPTFSLCVSFSNQHIQNHYSDPPQHSLPSPMIYFPLYYLLMSTTHILHFLNP